MSGNTNPSWSAPMWLSVAWGVTIGAALGVLGFWLISRSKQKGLAASELGKAPPIPSHTAYFGKVPTFLPLGAMMGQGSTLEPAMSYANIDHSTEPLSGNVDFFAGGNGKTKLATVTVSDTETTQLMMASGGKAWAVQVRTVGPAGSIALFGHDTNTITGNVNTPGVLAIPAGSFGDVFLAAGEALYARGSVPNTMVSISARMVD